MAQRWTFGGLASIAAILGACATASALGTDDAATDAPTDGNPDGAPDGPSPAECAARTAGWQTLEAGYVVDSDTASDPNAVMLLAHSSGDLMYAVNEGNSLVVRRFADDAWSQVGDVVDINGGNTPSYSGYLAEAGGSLYLSAAEFGGVDGTGVYVLRLDGMSWVVVGSEISTASASVQQAPVVVHDGELSVFWSQYFDANTIGKNRINGGHWNGTTWTAIEPSLGQIAGPGASAISPQAAITAAGRIYLVFAESGAYIRYRDLADTMWQTLGPGTFGTSAFDPKIALGGDGTVYVAYSQYDAGDGETNAYVARYNGTGFEQLVELNQIAGHANIKGLVIDGTRIVVAWAEGTEPNRTLYVGTVAGGGVSLLGTPRGTLAGDASLAIDGCGDAVVAYTNGVTNARVVRVERFH